MKPEKPMAIPADWTVRSLIDCTDDGLVSRGVVQPSDDIGSCWINICLQSHYARQFLQTGTKRSTEKCPDADEPGAVPIPLPPKPVRQAIESLLTGWDGKIQCKPPIDQTLEGAIRLMFNSWFVDFEPVRAKIAAKARWLAMQPVGESASPVCYAGEAQQLPDLATWMNFAAMVVIAGGILFTADTSTADAKAALQRLQSENPEHYADLLRIAELFPAEMQETEAGEIPLGWRVFPTSGVAP